MAREMKRDADGTYRATFTLEPDDGATLRRALMRVEADLLREDADWIGRPGSENPVRTHDQRAADALVRLVQTIGSSPDWNQN